MNSNKAVRHTCTMFTAHSGHFTSAEVHTCSPSEQRCAAIFFQLAHSAKNMPCGKRPRRSKLSESFEHAQAEQPHNCRPNAKKARINTHLLKAIPCTEHLGRCRSLRDSDANVTSWANTGGFMESCQGSLCDVILLPPWAHVTSPSAAHVYR